MRIAVAGGTGVAGRYTVMAAREAGHDVVVLARARGVDVVTGTGLAEALDGVDVVVDTLNAGTAMNRDRATTFFVEAARNLQLHGAMAGVHRIVVLSIVGVDRVPGFAYYRAKLAHEAAARSGSVPVSVLRATQFHEFAGQMLDRASLGPVAAVPSMWIRPVAARTVGHRLVEVATASEAGDGTWTELAGPEETGLVDLARRTARCRKVHRIVVPVHLPGEAGRALRGGALLPGPDAVVAGPGPDEWLASDDAA